MARKQAKSIDPAALVAAAEATDVTLSTSAKTMAAQARASEDAVKEIVSPDDADKKKKLKRTNIFGQRSYYFETHDEDNKKIVGAPTESEWREQILSDTQKAVEAFGAWCAIIFHDSDIDEKGGKKPLHCHYVFKFINSKAHDVDYFVKNYEKATGFDYTRYGKKLPDHVQVVRNFIAASRYLIHISEQALSDKKFIYDISDIIVFARDGKTRKSPVARLSDEKALEHAQWMMHKDGDDADDENAEIPIKTAWDFMNYLAQMVRCGHITVAEAEILTQRNPLDLEIKGGVALWTQWEKRIKTARSLYEESVRKFYSNPNHHRALITCYVEGPGSAGKSDIAMHLADLFRGAEAVHDVATGSARLTHDPADSYDMAPAVMIDEASGASYDVAQWCAVMDARRASMVSSRNHNRFWNPALAVMTNSTPLEQFVTDMVQPFLRDVIKGAPDAVDVKDIDHIARREWDKFYAEYGANYADKYVQVRRRIPLWLQIVPKDDDRLTVRISILDAAKNVSRPNDPHPTVTDRHTLDIDKAFWRPMMTLACDGLDRAHIRFFVHEDDPSIRYALVFIRAFRGHEYSVTVCDGWDARIETRSQWGSNAPRYVVGGSTAELGHLRIKCDDYGKCSPIDLEELYAQAAAVIAPALMPSQYRMSVSPCYKLLHEIEVAVHPTADDYAAIDDAFVDSIVQFYVLNGYKRSHWAFPPTFDLADPLRPLPPRNDVHIPLPPEYWEDDGYVDEDNSQE